jgi:hypothetical protein
MADRFRAHPRELAPEEQARVAAVKQCASELEGLMGEGTDMRCVSLARTRLEEAVFRAVKGITA